MFNTSIKKASIIGLAILLFSSAWNTQAEEVIFTGDGEPEQSGWLKDTWSSGSTLVPYLLLHSSGYMQLLDDSTRGGTLYISQIH